jgi:hypothetical protein
MGDLSSVLWIGGPPGAGKTTVARLIARRRGLRWYNADAHTWEHRDRAIAAGHPAAIRWEAMSIAERWSASPEDMLAMSLHNERGPMILDDLRALPASPLTIAEGTPITPSIAGAGHRAVWLLPSAQVQRTRLAERNLSPGVLELYRSLARMIGTQVEEYGARTLIVDDRCGIEETIAEVERLFSDVLDSGLVATTTQERRCLLRYANRAIVEQHLAFSRRPWAPGNARTAVRAFACECGRSGCEEQIELAITDFPSPPDTTSPPVLAFGHRVLGHVRPPPATRESPGSAGCTSRRGCSRMDRPPMR